MLILFGLLLKGIMYVWSDVNWVGFIYMLGGSFLFFGYIVGFVWLYVKYEKLFLIKVFESVGRILFSNYLM